jgi:hypothetical protein
VRLKPPVLVTDGEQRAALAVVRSLGRAGYPIYVCSTRRRSLAGASCHANGQAAVPDPLREPARFVEEISVLSERWRIGALLPIAEPSLLALLPERARFPGVAIPFAAYERFHAI